MSDSDSAEDDDDFVLVPPTVSNLHSRSPQRRSLRRRFSMQDETSVMTTKAAMVLCAPLERTSPAIQNLPGQFQTEGVGAESPVPAARCYQQLDIEASTTPPPAEPVLTQSPPLLYLRRTIG
jgi:hypothetical protein